VTARALGVTVLALSSLGILAFGGQSLARVWQMRHDVESLEREIIGLRAETTELQTAIARLRSDPDSIEKVAREALGLVKPGERVLKLPSSLGGP
jgi:cell division protein FtsB